MTRVIFIGLSWFFALGWCGLAWQWLRHVGEIPDLAEVPLHPASANQSSNMSDGAPDAMHDAMPDLTVVVPACNEEAAIAGALERLLAQQEIRLEVVAVDDRSTDATGALMDRIAAENRGPHSLHVEHVCALPPGWLGKPHALVLAAAQARAPWLLFTDGDVQFSPDALARALALAEREQLDHLVVMPEWTMERADERAMYGTMHAFSTWGLRPWKVGDARARDFIGVGGFNLVRREVYASLGGFEAMRMEVLEDLRLGWRVKRGGWRQGVARGTGMVALRWSSGAMGAVRNLEKNLFALHRYRVATTLGACAGTALCAATPVVDLFLGGWARAAGVVTFAALVMLYAAARRVTRVPVGYVICFPLAGLLLAYAMARSLMLALWRGGVLWRGTLYPLRQLRAQAGPAWWRRS